MIELDLAAKLGVDIPEPREKYSEGAYLVRDEGTGRINIRAWNQCGHDATDVDLFDLLEHIGIEAKERVGQ